MISNNDELWHGVFAPPRRENSARPLTDLAFAMSVRMGNLWVPINGITSFLSKYCTHIFCLTGHRTFPYSLRGSGSAVKIGRQHFVFLFKHQVFPDFHPDQIVISPLGDLRTFVSATSYHFADDGITATDDFTDMCGLRFAVEKYDINGFGTGFFHSIPADIWPNNSQGIFLIYGYPSCLQGICPNGTSIAAKSVYVTASYSGLGYEPFVHRLSLVRRTQFDPDGLSGGLVLHLGKDQQGYFVGLAGFIVRGGRGTETVHFVEAKAAHVFASNFH